MTNKAPNQREREHDFALIVDGVDDLDDVVENALFEAGCDDATVSMQYGLLYIEFSRSAASLKDAIISAIEAVEDAGIGAQVRRVDDCNLVTASDIARRIKRSRQLIHQYMNAERGPGGFPPPECYLVDRKPLWAWCEVSFWLAQNNLLRHEDSWDAEVVAAINNALEVRRQKKRHPQLVEDVNRELLM